MSATYDAGASIIGTAIRISSSVLPEVVSQPEFWILLTVNIVVKISVAWGFYTPEFYSLQLPLGLTGVTGSLMTFFVCFYNGQQFGRYNYLYETAQALFEHTLEFASMLRVQMPHKGIRRKAAKLMIGSAFLTFFEMTNAQVSTAEFRVLHKLRLLTKDEIMILKKHMRHCEDDAIPSFMLLQWACSLVISWIEDKPAREDMIAAFLSKAGRVRACQAHVKDTMDLPMPFQYFHIMNLMLALNLILWAYSLGCQDSLFAPVIFMFVQMMFQGIRELSTSLADPFGHDEVDFPINKWMQTMYLRIYEIVECEVDASTLKNIPSGAMLKPGTFTIDLRDSLEGG
eukprot:TRINITY_DN16627_c0_g2_i1.p1 TRINITY_DN16627_c0_g2~~TRINITY_DN16627_c0_g2_i1.p1  ORF type:complete len:342 (+),score=49.12 TRINITY_DN16627_c0_g2_i1:138-1163(+)